MAILTAKALNESSACGSVVTYESATMSAVRSLVLDGSPGILVRLNNVISSFMSFIIIRIITVLKKFIQFINTNVHL